MKPSEAATSGHATAHAGTCERSVTQSARQHFGSEQAAVAEWQQELEQPSMSSSIRSSHHRHHRSSSRCSDSSHRRNLSEVMTFRFACIQKSYLHRLSGPVQGEQGGDYDDAGVGMAYHVNYGRATSTTATITRVACGCTLRRPRQ